MFNRDQFIADLKSARAEADNHLASKEIMERAFADPTAIINELGAPSPETFGPLYQSDELTILNAVWAPEMCLRPHNHNMWAVIGIYEGREDNVYWRRIKDDPRGRIEAAGAKDLGKGDVVPLGAEIIHSVFNPARKFAGALHVYGGNFFDEPRSEWDPEARTEQPYDLEANMAHFAEENARWKDVATKSA